VAAWPRLALAENWLCVWLALMTILWRGWLAQIYSRLGDVGVGDAMLIIICAGESMAKEAFSSSALAGHRRLKWQWAASLYRRENGSYGEETWRPIMYPKILKVVMTYHLVLRSSETVSQERLMADINL